MSSLPHSQQQRRNRPEREIQLGVDPSKSRPQWRLIVKQGPAWSSAIPVLYLDRYLQTKDKLVLTLVIRGITKYCATVTQWECYIVISTDKKYSNF